MVGPGCDDALLALVETRVEHVAVVARQTHVARVASAALGDCASLLLHRTAGDAAAHCAIRRTVLADEELGVVEETQAAFDH